MSGVWHHGRLLLNTERTYWYGRTSSFSPTTKTPRQWHSSLRDGNADSSTDDEEPPLSRSTAPAHVPRSPKPQKPRGSVHGQEPERTESFSWLLNSDDSQSRAGSPHDFFQSSYYDD